MRFIPILLLLAGCGFTPQGDAVRELIEIRAHRAANQSAANALRYLCSYARVGSISKLFPDEEGRAAYSSICTGLKPLTPKGPIE